MPNKPVPMIPPEEFMLNKVVASNIKVPNLINN